MAAPRVLVSSCLANQAQGDAPFTMQLVTDLRSAGAEVVLAEADLTDHDFIEYLNQALPGSPWLLVILTPETLSSSRVQLTVQTALGLVLQQRMQGVLVVRAAPYDAKQLPPTWHTLKIFDACQDYPRALAQLLLALGVERPQQVTPPKDSPAKESSAAALPPVNLSSSSLEDEPAPLRSKHTQTQKIEVFSSTEDGPMTLPARSRSAPAVADTTPCEDVLDRPGPLFLYSYFYCYGWKPCEDVLDRPGPLVRSGEKPATGHTRQQGARGLKQRTTAIPSRSFFKRLYVDGSFTAPIHSPTVSALSQSAPALGDATASQDLPHKPGSLFSGEKPATSFRQRWPQASALLLLAVLLALLLLTVLLVSGSSLYTISRGKGAATSVTVTITPASKDVTKVYAITAVTGTPAPSLHEVPAHVLSSRASSGKVWVAATGIGYTAGVQARGLVWFDVWFHGRGVIRAGMVFTGRDGVQVVIDQTQTCYDICSVAIEAHTVKAGTSGNIYYADFDQGVPGCSDCTVYNADFHGGQDPQMYRFVQQGDIDGLANPLIPSLTRKAQAALQAQLHENEQLAASAECTPTVTSDQNTGDQVTSFGVTVSVTCTGEVYNIQAALARGTDLFMNDPVTSGYAVLGTKSTIMRAALVNPQRGIIALTIAVVGTEVFQFSNTQLQKLIKLIAGKSADAAQALLLHQIGVSKVTIKIPESAGKILPVEPGYIKIEVVDIQVVQVGRAN